MDAFSEHFTSLPIIVTDYDAISAPNNTNTATQTRPTAPHQRLFHSKHPHELAVVANRFLAICRGSLELHG